MKKNGFFMGMLTMVLALGLVGCKTIPDDDNEDTGGKDTGYVYHVGTWSDDGTTVKAIINGNDVTTITAFDSNDIITVTVGGTAYDYNFAWKAKVYLGYEGVVGKNYTYSFNAWVDSGTYIIGKLRYDGSWTGEGEKYLHNDGWGLEIGTDSTKVYTFTSSEPLVYEDPRLELYCGKQTGTFHLKMVSIIEEE
jgi:hypothetical protein